MAAAHQQRSRFYREDLGFSSIPTTIELASGITNLICPKLGTVSQKVHLIFVTRGTQVRTQDTKLLILKLDPYGN